MSWVKFSMKPLFFNLHRLESATQNSPDWFMYALYYHWQGITIPKNSRQKYKPITALAGNSFLLNPQDFFNCNSTDVLFKVQYVKLAGRRDYTNYKAYGYKHLDTSMYPDLDYTSLSYNPLLKIAKNTISFKYEE